MHWYNKDENEIFVIYPELLCDLLINFSTNKKTKKNIIWATNQYSKHGNKYRFKSEITSVTQKRIVERNKKNKLDQSKRSKDTAEVFTPSWMCNAQNNQVDNCWFNYENSFNKECDKSWHPTKKVEFNNLSWQKYILSTRLEVSCGEAPYIVSRYDTTTSNKIALVNRVGFLDRKLRVIKENVGTNQEDWVHWSLIAIKNVYGFEWQGDNLFLARKNILFSYIDYYFDSFKKLPPLGLLKDVAKIICWNFWQMDGLKFVTPNSCKHNIKRDVEIQCTLFEEQGKEQASYDKCFGCEKNEKLAHNGIYCYIMDWKENKTIRFVDIFKGDHNE